MKKQLIFLLACSLSSPLLAQTTFTWDGNSNAVWGVATNWTADSGSPGSNDQANFNGSGNGNTTIDLGATTTVGRIVFNDAGAAAYTIGSGGAGNQTLLIEGGNGRYISLNSTAGNSQTIDADIITGGSDGMSINNYSTSQTLTINGDVKLGGWQSFSTVAGSEIILNGNNNDASGTTLKGAGTLTANSLDSGGNFFNNQGTVNLQKGQVIKGIVLGHATEGNANATWNIASGKVMTLGNADIVYVADDDTANTATVAGGTIHLSGNRDLNVADNALVSGPELTVSSDIRGNADNRDLVKLGAGTVLLTGNNYTNTATTFGVDEIMVQEGTVQIESDANLGDDWVTLGWGNNDGTLEYVGTGGTIDNKIRVGQNALNQNGNGIILANGTGAVTFSGNTGGAGAAENITRTLTLGGSSTADNTYAGQIANMDTANDGILGLTKTGSGKWIIGGNATYTGDTTVEDGTLVLGGTLSQTDVSVESGAKLELGGSNKLNDFSGLTVASGATFDMVQYSDEVGSLSGGGLITNSGTGSRSVLAVDIAGASTFSGTIDQQNDGTEYMQLTKRGAGTLTLTGDNDYRNLLIYGGTVQVDSADALGSGKWADQIGKVDTDGTLEFIGDSDTTYSHDWTIGDANDVDGTGNAIIKSSTTGGSKVVISVGNSGNKPTVNRTLTLGGASTADNEVSGQLTDHTDGGNVGVIKDGSGKWILSNGANSYSGTTTIEDGSLVFQKKGALYNNVEADWTEANITVKSGGTLAVGTYAAGLNSSGFGANSIETLINGLSTSAAGGFEDGSSVGFDTTWSGDFSYGKVIADTAEGTLGVRKLGANALTLNNANTYTGITDVEAGTLIIDGDQSAATGGVTIGANGLLMGSGTIGGVTTVAGGLNPGNSPGALTFNEDLTIESTATLTLEFATLTSYDQLLNDAVGTDTLTVDSGATIILDFTGAVFADGDTLTMFQGWESLIDNGGSISVVGTDDSNLDYSGLLTGGTIDVVAAIPEPAVMSLVLLFGGGMLFLKRRFVK